MMQHRPYFEKEEADATYEYMSSDAFLTEFKKTTEMEEMIKQHIGCKHTIMTTSGTTAIYLALASLKLPQGSEVIVPNFTMIATVNAVKSLGMTPVQRFL